MGVEVEVGRERSPSLAGRREAGVWQCRCWEHTIRDDRDYAARLECVRSIGHDGGEAGEEGSGVGGFGGVGGGGAAGSAARRG